jgi:hypothetical protein
MAEGTGQGYLLSLLRNGAMPFARPARGGAAFAGGERFRQLTSTHAPSFHSETHARPFHSETHDLPLRSDATRARPIEHRGAVEPSVSVAPPLEAHHESNLLHADADQEPATEGVSRAASATVDEIVNASATFDESITATAIVDESVTASAIVSESLKAALRHPATEVREDRHARVMVSEIAKAVENKKIGAGEDKKIGADSSSARRESDAETGELRRSQIIATTTRANTTHQGESDRAAPETAPSFVASREESSTRDAPQSEASGSKPRVFKEHVHDLRFLYREPPSQEPHARPAFLKPDEGSLTRKNSTEVVEADSHEINTQKPPRDADNSSNGSFETRDERSVRIANQPAGRLNERDADPASVQVDRASVQVDPASIQVDSASVQVDPASVQAKEESADSSPSTRAPYKVHARNLRHLFRGAAQSATPLDAALSSEQTSVEEIDDLASLTRRSRNAESIEADVRQEEQPSKTEQQVSKTEQQMRARKRDEIAESLAVETRRSIESEARRSIESSVADQTQSDLRRESKDQIPRHESRDQIQIRKELPAQIRKELSTPQSVEDDESLAAHGSLARDAPRGQGASINGEGVFSLKVNRLDVKLINQAPKSAPAPPAHAPKSPPQAADYLERHYLGRFYLDV